MNTGVNVVKNATTEPERKESKGENDDEDS
jgi:hypothetical protein